MIKIAHIADCHLRSTQYGSKERGYAFFKGLMSAVQTAIAKEKVDVILCAGDLLDGPYPSADIVADQLQQVHRYLREHDTPMLVINGNHDNTKTPWSDVFCKNTDPDRAGLQKGIISIDNKGYGVADKDIDVNTTAITVKGIPFCHPDELRRIFASMKESGERADIVMWHGEILEFCGYPKEGCITMSDFPEGMFKLAAVGDQHVHRHIKRDIDGLVVAYPGSTELCSSSEDWQKAMYVYTFDNRELVDIKDVPFKTQKVQRFDIRSVEDLEQAYSSMHPGALVFIDYLPQVKGCLARLQSFVDKHPGTILRPHVIVEDKVKAVDIDYNDTPQEVPSLHEYAWTTMSDTQKSQRVAGLVKDLMNPASAHREAIDKYCEEVLNNDNGTTTES